MKKSIVNVFFKGINMLKISIPSTTVYNQLLLHSKLPSLYIFFVQIICQQTLKLQRLTNEDLFLLFSQPDSSVLPVFDQFVNDGVVKDSFSMQLCGSSEIDFSSEPTVAGTMVSFNVSFIFSYLFVYD